MCENGNFFELNPVESLNHFVGLLAWPEPQELCAPWI
jgi:hypothetical protein